MILKEWLKFMKAFEIIQALPTEWEALREDLEISISTYAHNTTKFYETWMTEAYTNASNKGYALLFKERNLPALVLKKEFKNNSIATNVVSEESKKKFKEAWEKTVMDIEADNIRKNKIMETVKQRKIRNKV